MTGAEYQRLKEMFETRFRQDMAALERIWFAIHGANPPDSVVKLAVERDPAAVPAADPAPVGDPTTRSWPEERKLRKKIILTPARREKKREYMRRWLAKRKAAKAGKE